MGAGAILLTLLFYFGLLFIISFITGRNADNTTFFIANRQSPWYVVAYGMIGASLSGVTFLSVPGSVQANGFSYMQIVFGYLVGYAVIAQVLLPLYYRLNLTSIYGYLEQRFGKVSHLTGASFFLLSRIIGASFRLFLVALVLHTFVFKEMGLAIAFHWTVILTILFIWLYTFRGGIKTVVWTDTLQTTFMLLSVVLTIALIGSEMHWSAGEMVYQIKNSGYGRIFHLEEGWSNPHYFFKSFLSGMFITIVMTGLDQDMMQKNLTCKTLAESQKNMYWFSLILVVVNLVFLSLGALLYLYADAHAIVIPSRVEGGPPSPDLLFPAVAIKHLPVIAGFTFVIGLFAAAYSSADSALTALTTSVCVDFLKLKGQEDSRIRYLVHAGVSILIVLTITGFYQLYKITGSNDSIIWDLFKAAGYTYGPLLGLYSFGLFTKRKVRDRWVWAICLLAPVISYILNDNSAKWLNGYQFGFEILIVNGLLTFAGLWLISKKPDTLSDKS